MLTNIAADCNTFMKKTVFLFLLLILTAELSHAAIVKGSIVDEKNNALDYVNVTLTSLSDKTDLYGAISDVDGNFTISSVPVGEYELSVSFIGYTTVTRKVSVKTLNDNVNVGKLRLSEDAQVLEAVEVVGQASQMRFDIDKKVFNVDQNLASSGASATDMLENIPSIDVDNDGNVSLRNNSSVEIWINGKPSGLTEDNRAQILEQMPAGSIQAVEVITNPSAKFNPEGTAGIINLVLKKERNAGYYGSGNGGVNYNVGGVPGGNLGLNFNYNSTIVDFYANLGIRYHDNRSGRYSDRYSFAPGTEHADTLSFLNTSTNGKRNFLGLFGRVGVDFHIDKRNTISLSGMGHGGWNHSDELNRYTQYSWLDGDTTLYNRSNLRNGMFPSYSVAIDYVHEFDDKGSDLRANVEYSGHQNSGDYFYTQKSIRGNMADYNQIQRKDGKNQSAIAKVDYTQKFGGNMKLETGVYGSWQQRISPSRTWDEQPDGSRLLTQFNDFDYNELIAALYATYGAKFGNLSFSAGLRGEYTATQVGTRDSETAAYEITDRHYWQLYPTAFISYAFPNDHELQANYTRRIQRPRGRQLNAFRNVSDSTNIEFGNPLLHPEISSAVELNYIKTWENHALTAGLYYRYTNNQIERVRYLDENNVMNTTFENISKRQSLGLELVAKNKVAKWLNLTTTVNCFYSALNDVYYDTDMDGIADLLYEAQQNFAWNARVMANFLIPMGFSAQLTAQYRSPDIVAQGKSAHQYSIDLGVRKSFLNRKLNLSLSVRDLLNSRKWVNTTWGDNFWQYSEFSPRGTMISLSITYNFGNQKLGSKAKRNDSGSERSDGMGEMEEY